MYWCIIVIIMSFFRSTAFATALSDTRPAVAIVTGGKSGIGKAIAIKIASFPFIQLGFALFHDHLLGMRKNFIIKFKNPSYICVLTIGVSAPTFTR